MGHEYNSKCSCPECFAQAWSESRAKPAPFREKLFEEMEEVKKRDAILMRMGLEYNRQFKTEAEARLGHTIFCIQRFRFKQWPDFPSSDGGLGVEIPEIAVLVQDLRLMVARLSRQFSAHLKAHDEPGRTGSIEI